MPPSANDDVNSQNTIRNDSDHVHRQTPAWSALIHDGDIEATRERACALARLGDLPAGATVRRRSSEKSEFTGAEVGEEQTAFPRQHSRGPGKTPSVSAQIVELSRRTVLRLRRAREDAHL